MKKTIPIFMYHSIAKPPKETAMKSLYVTPKNFGIQMRILKLLGYQGLSMNDLQPYLRGEKQGKVVGITFDDGYENNLTYAAPLLKKLGFTATCYLVSERLGGYNQWDENSGIAHNPLMAVEQVHQWLDSGLEIGAHTCTHANLTQLTTEQAKQEIEQSKQQLENLFQQPITAFCYPYGAYNAAIYQQVKQAGFSNATTIDKALTVIDEHDRFALPRVFIAYRTLPHLFLMKIFGWYKA